MTVREIIHHYAVKAMPHHNCGSNLNLLRDSLLSVGKVRTVSLPGLFAAMSRGEDITFRALRPHQRPAWHMFCVQLAALALWHGGEQELPTEEGRWRDLLRGLTPDFPDDEPWCLVVADRGKPAFLQPPDPGGLKWTEVPTPDALDMLITARNHDLKQQVMHQATPEDWLFALVSLQTMEGYGGRSNHGIARMNGGSSSRVVLGLAPQPRRQDIQPDPVSWWRRDVHVLLRSRAEGVEEGPCTPGGKALLWLEDWPEGAQLAPQDLDPWFIEVCRRVRLKTDGTPLRAERSPSKAARTNAKQFNGVLGDSWAPVERTSGKTLTLGENGRFDYKRLNRLLLSGDWDLPLCARPQTDDGDMLLVAEAIARGNSKTGGFASRIIPIPSGMVNRFSAPEMQQLAKDQIKEIEQFGKALRNALALLAANGDYESLDKEHYTFARPAHATFDARADELFFPALWERVEAHENSDAALKEAQQRFNNALARIAIEEFEAALPAIPGSSLFRPRAEVRARDALFRQLRHAGFELHGSAREAAHAE